MKIGFLGCGNMGGALMQGVLRMETPLFESVSAYDPSPAARDKLAALGVTACDSALDLCLSCDAIVLAVKPQMMEAALAPCADALDGRFVISIAAGWPVAKLRRLLPAGTHLLRVMPNTPSLVGMGMCVLCSAPELTDSERAAAEAMFSAVGEYVWLDEKYIDAATGIQGSGPAYVYMMIDALACGGVFEGLPRDMAVKMAAQTLKGAAQMVLDTGAHPDALKDAVCSPGGTTIEAVRLLEQRGLRAALMDAVIACADKARDMSK